MIFALCAPVLFSIVGFAVDYGNASYLKRSLDDALDAGVLAAVSQSAAGALSGGYGNTSGLQTYGQNVFHGDIAKLAITVTPAISVTSNGSGGVNASGSYSYSMPTLFAGMIGMSVITIKGAAKTAANPLTYINYYVLLDISQSMGLAATAADQTALYNRVAAYGNGAAGESGCVFGCHVKTGGQGYTNEYLAHNVSPTVTLRIDSAVSAIQRIIADAQTAAGSTLNIKIGLYTMSQDPVSGTTVNTVASPSSNYAQLNTTAGTIDLGGNTSNGYGDSNFPVQLTKFNTILPSNGTGASASSPLNYVFIITDGMLDTYGSGSNCTWSHCMGAFDPSSCTALKAKATVGTIYTTYLPVYAGNNSSNGVEFQYAALAQPYVSQLAGNLQTCATASNFYYEASDGPSITTGMRNLFASSQLSARLVQ